MKSTARIFGLFAFVFIISVAGLAEATEGTLDWHQWRGPNRDGVSAETGLLKQWPAQGPELAWKVSGLGGGYSGISVADGRIYTMGDGPDGCNLEALDVAGGKPIWSTKIGAPGGGGGYPGPRCTPTVDGGMIYALGQFGDLVCVDVASGKERWHKNLKKDFAGVMMSGWGYAESPLVDGNNVICTPGGAQGTLAALNKTSGELVWRSKEFTDKAAYASLIVEEIGGVRQYIQLTDASVAGISAADGRLLWKAPRVGATAVIPTPVFFDNQVFVTSGYGIGCNLFKIAATGGQFTAEQVYANKNLVNHHGGVVLVDGYIYGTGDPLTCLELNTGKVMWKNPCVGKGSVTCADGHLYVRSEGGPVALVEVSSKGYVEKGRFNQPERSDKNSWPHPVIVGGKLYLRDQDKLFCYDVKAK